MNQQERNRRISEGLRLAWKRRKGKAMATFGHEGGYAFNEDQRGGHHPDAKPKPSESSNQTLSKDELTERFYVVREQRNRLLWACRKALDAFDAAHKEGKGTWSGEAVDEMRMAVAQASAIYQPTKCLGKPEDYDPMADLIAANRDEILRKHQDAIRLIRTAIEPIATCDGAADQRLTFNRANYALAVLDALNTFHPMHGESWCGWPSDAAPPKQGLMPLTLREDGTFERMDEPGESDRPA